MRAHEQGGGAPTAADSAMDGSVGGAAGAAESASPMVAGVGSAAEPLLLQPASPAGGRGQQEQESVEPRRLQPASLALPSTPSQGRGRDSPGHVTSNGHEHMRRDEYLAWKGGRYSSRAAGRRPLGGGGRVSSRGAVCTRALSAPSASRPQSPAVEDAAPLGGDSGRGSVGDPGSVGGPGSVGDLGSVGDPAGEPQSAAEPQLAHSPGESPRRSASRDRASGECQGAEQQGASWRALDEASGGPAIGQANSPSNSPSNTPRTH